MSKFLPPSAFAADGAYTLLPFNFTPLDGEHYVATNMVGEYVRLDRRSLERLVTHELSPDEPLFRDLRAKHFFEVHGDRSPRELLALKTRTRYQRLPNFTNLHIFVATLRCDHSCPYCQVSRQSEDRAAFDMSRETADHSIELMFRSPSPALKLEFQGGEPLLNFDLVRYVVEKAEDRARVSRVSWRLLSPQLYLSRRGKSSNTAATIASSCQRRSTDRPICITAIVPGRGGIATNVTCKR